MRLRRYNFYILLGLLATTVALQLQNFKEDIQLSSDVSDEFANRFSDEYLTYLEIGLESIELHQLSKQLATSHSQKDIFTGKLAEASLADKFFACTTCRATVNVFVRTLREPEGELSGPNRNAYAKQMALDLCKRFNLQTERICAGLFDLNWPILDYIFNNTISDSNSFCAILPVEICQVSQPEYNISLSIPDNGPKLNGSKTDLPKRSENEFHILQLTDIHYDPEYVIGSLASCEEPLCCRDAPLGNDALNSTLLAGHWGDYRECDTPLHVIEQALKHIQGEHDLDIIYYTGDIPPHNLWSTTKAGNLEMLTKIDELIVSHFPNIPIYTCLGNHEPHPGNVFGNEKVPEELNVLWLYDHVWSLWSKYLPIEAKATVLRGGYYTVLTHLGHRIVALNSMDCYLFNWWVFYNGSIVIEQLNWLQETLLEAEKKNEYVHILSHIPSGDSDCWANWAREYNRILARFSHIITGIFNGHTHKDEMNVHYTDEGYAVAVSWNGGSLTPYSDTNPNYRLYDVAAETMQVVDHHTWIYNLSAANELGPAIEPKWFKEYSFSELFTEDTSPAGVDNLLLKMAMQPNLLRLFWRLKFTSADPQINIGCNSSCLNSTICRLATTNYHSKQRCHELQTILTESLYNEGNENTTSNPTNTTSNPINTTSNPSNTTSHPNNTTATPSNTTAVPEITTQKPGGGGSASLTAMSMGCLWILFLMRSYLF